jgi:dimethylamine/trimethylamine dehydrogenase
MYVGSQLSAADVVELALAHVFVATGAMWRSDGVGRSSRTLIPVSGGVEVLTPDDLMGGASLAPGRVLVYDDDQIYLGGVLAQHLRKQGRDVILATPSTMVSPWTEMTLEQERVQSALIAAGVHIETGRVLANVNKNGATLECFYGGVPNIIACGSVVMVTERRRETALYDELCAMRDRGDIALETLELIGDAAQPGLIADATYAGHMAARLFQEPYAQSGVARWLRPAPPVLRLCRYLRA